VMWSNSPGLEVYRTPRGGGAWRILLDSSWDVEDAHVGIQSSGGGGGVGGGGAAPKEGGCVQKRRFNMRLMTWLVISARPYVASYPKVVMARPTQTRTGSWRTRI